MKRPFRFRDGLRFAGRKKGIGQVAAQSAKETDAADQIEQVILSAFHLHMLPCFH